MSKLSVSVSKHDHMQGSIHAACTLVEYGDYECPSCADVQPLVKELQTRFGDQLCFVFRNFPLREMHPFAEAAAEVAEYAATQDKFWEMHDLLFEKQEDLSAAMLKASARKLGLSDTDLQAARSKGTLKHRIDADLAGGIRSGVHGTPTFFINEKRYDGSMDVDSFADAVQQLLDSPAG